MFKFSDRRLQLIAGAHILSLRIAAPKSKFSLVASHATIPVYGNNPSYTSLTVDLESNNIISENVKALQIQSLIMGLSNNQWFSIKEMEIGIEAGRDHISSLNYILSYLSAKDFDLDRLFRDLFLTKVYERYISKYSKQYI